MRPCPMAQNKAETQFFAVEYKLRLIWPTLFGHTRFFDLEVVNAKTLNEAKEKVTKQIEAAQLTGHLRVGKAWKIRSTSIFAGQTSKSREAKRKYEAYKHMHVKRKGK